MNRAICMSPRRGTCEYLTERAKEAGFAPVYLRELAFAPCDGCEACSLSGVCRHKDCASALLSQIREGGKTLFITPLYFCNFPAFAKAFLDRAQAFWAKKEKCGARFYLLAVGGQGEENNFSSAYLTFRAFCIAMGAECAGAMYLGHKEGAADITEGDVRALVDMIK